MEWSDVTKAGDEGVGKKGWNHGGRRRDLPTYYPLCRGIQMADWQLQLADIWYHYEVSKWRACEDDAKGPLYVQLYYHGGPFTPLL